MPYNTQQERLPLPEYGRSIQNMVDYALTIEDRKERQRCANTIVDIMGNMFPHLRDVPDFKHKLWDHLAIMSGFKLDIDYPYELIKPDNLQVAPDRIPYSDGKIHYRHYGAVIERLIPKALEMPEGPMRDQLIKMIAIHMKKCYIAWNKDSVDDAKIFEDLADYTDGKIDWRGRDLQLSASPQQPQRPFNNNGQRRPARSNNNQRRKFPK